MEFDRARRTLREAEQLLVKSKPLKEGDSAIAIFFDTLLVGPWLVLAGTRILSRRIGLVLLVASALVVYLWVMERHAALSSVFPALAMAAGSACFGLPSRIVTAGVKSENIAELALFIREISPMGDDVDRLALGVSVLRTQTFERLGRFNVLAGIGWAALFWYGSSHVFAPGLEPKILGDGLVHTVVAACIFFFILAVASSHSTAIRAVHQTLDFAILEVKAQLANENI